ncbi:hypothetical protein Jab_2c20050 [Janthinobacterium sp. HH01]|uniref:hypothetical protein n=1 Tax=Janthinobacterium sp. HH01 TaxID=1198452 RepID=UPI0002AE88A3|nr:hypothetical protein [Janthinobacterium sp. HH01]ELX09921.1 hypothetical protein Jab_2c20050 [Janthinobacterium sp. HH01]
MATDYTIYIINKAAEKKNFWCFLDTPAMSGGGKVYANSSANLNVESDSEDTNSFTIPLQYSVGAGASNKAVGLDVLVQSHLVKDAELGQVWNADYATMPDKAGPKLQLDDGATSPGKTLGIVTNDFDEGANDAGKWYQSQTFGINSESGFMGVTWKPSPDDDCIITPKFAFYIATGSFASNKLADMTTVSVHSAKVTLEDFSRANEAWVVLDSKGKWHVSKTDPALTQRISMHKLLDSHNQVVQAHAQLVAYASDLSAHVLPAALDPQVRAIEAATSDQTDTIDNVTWDKRIVEAGGPGGPITGTIMVAIAATFAFTSFICGGIKFRAHGVTKGATRWKFSYDGEKSLPVLKEVLKSGAKITASAE